MSPKLICHQNWNVTESEMSPKLKFHQRWIVTKTEVSSKLKYYQDWNVTKHFNIFKNQNQNSRDLHWIPWSCSLTDWLTESSFWSKSSRHCLSQTVRAGQLKFQRMFTPNHVSHVTSHMSGLTCQVSRVKCWSVEFKIIESKDCLIQYFWITGLLNSQLLNPTVVESKGWWPWDCKIQGDWIQWLLNLRLLNPYFHAC